MKKLLLAPIALLAAGTLAQTDNRFVYEPVPEKVSVPQAGAVPSDAIVLFDGSNMDAWMTAATEEDAHWEIADGAMTVRSGMRTIKTRRLFGDIQLHLEFRPSELVQGEGQSRGNSGVFLHSLFEVQVLDSWNNPTYVNGQAGAIYLQSPPLVNVAREPGEWQSYDIIFQSPVYDGRGNLSEPAYVTVLHNGVLVQNHVALQGATYTPEPEYTVRCVPYGQEREQDCSGKMPITLQDHGQVVSYRNIWVREL